MNRRELLERALALAALAPLAPGLRAQDGDDQRFAQALFYALVPNPDLDPGFFTGLAQEQLGSPRGLSMLAAARDELLRISERDWMQLDTESRATLLIRATKSNAVEQVRRLVAGRVYSEPATFDRIGYGGSSLEFGGYLQHGFDDIDWLPENKSP